MNPVISCNHLSKTFKESGEEIHALQDVSFEVSPGSITGLLGPDGAGKTTLIRCLCGLLHPSQGTVCVLGADAVRQSGQIQGQIGYMPQKFGLYENMTVEENIRLYARLHGIPRDDYDSRVPMLLERNRLSNFTSRMAGDLSGGMKQKLALICALISRPKLMILDEPTVGVDVLARRELWNILRQTVAEESMTALVSTAYMDEADYCDRTLIIFEGKLLADKTPAEVKALSGETNVSQLGVRSEELGVDAKRSSMPSGNAFEQGFMRLMTGSVPEPLKRNNPVAADAPEIIRVENLVKRFGDFVAVNNVSFTVRRGEIFGLLGANGAGKTTTFRAMCALSRANEGTILFDGKPLEKNLEFARNNIGYVAQKFSLYGDISVRQNLLFFGGAYGLSGKKLRERIAWAVEVFNLSEYLNMIAAQLSMGYKRRLAMACALLHNPPILFLDEATSGADPIARREFWKRILALADDGVAVVITTHFLDEAAYCDRILIMRDGCEVASGTVEQIIAQGGGATLEDAFVNIVSQKTQTEAAP